MKALQKNQARTDQMLGAMADMLTSLALPNQQWSTENSDTATEAPGCQEWKRELAGPGQWDPAGIEDWEQVSNLERAGRDAAEPIQNPEPSQGFHVFLSHVAPDSNRKKQDGRLLSRPINTGLLRNSGSPKFWR
ncbi:hypothetical protein DPEC_G00013690 [Dallia pectoralis]|uniref:Uncharacterized protein n=1 Tax=Dallia pectoralis TaxID=75939 RepID=A0ACC2HMW4_DALPE|nr:hypothetical protein DPEC_G00013690 [Dallia pectoralis]